MEKRAWAIETGKCSQPHIVCNQNNFLYVMNLLLNSYPCHKQIDETIVF